MSQNQYQSNPYSQPYSQAPAAEAGYGYGGNAGYGQVSTGGPLRGVPSRT